MFVSTVIFHTPRISLNIKHSSALVPNVMTRDTSRVREERSFDGDDDILSALWAAAPFPYLPQDAPDELKKLTVEVEDPKQIYVIHNASRRHLFHLMVEKYVCLLVLRQ